VKRRDFLAATGAVGTMGAVDYTLRPPDRAVDVRVWLSERAARYGSLRSRITGYVARAFERSGLRARITFADTVDVSTEDAYQLLAGLEWPETLLTSVGDAAGPVDGVNLLVTDGDMTRTPSGGGVRHVAAIGGASSIAQMPPASDEPTVVPYSNRALVTQVLLHECGHALDLRHEDGAVRSTDDGHVVTPMVSAYAWAAHSVRDREFRVERSSCGQPIPTLDGQSRLQLAYSECATRRLQRRRGFSPDRR